MRRCICASRPFVTDITLSLQLFQCFSLRFQSLKCLLKSGDVEQHEFIAASIQQRGVGGLPHRRYLPRHYRYSLRSLHALFGRYDAQQGTVEELMHSSQLHYYFCAVLSIRNLLQIMFNMGIADMVNVVTQGIYAVCTMLRLEHTLPPRFE